MAGYIVNLVFTFYLHICLSQEKDSEIFYPDVEKPICKLQNESPGDCVHFLNCPNAAELIKKRKQPEICGFMGKYPIICCEMKKTIENIKTIPVDKFQELCNATYSKYKIRRRTRGIFGGMNAILKQFPHMAALGFGTKESVKYACGGSLISNKYVLTAAHCTYTRELGKVKFVRLGDRNLKSDHDNRNVQDFNIVRFINHPKYKASQVYNDIALIELDRFIVQTDYVAPACLPTTRKTILFDWTATGWGALGFGEGSSNILQRVFIYDVPISECRKYYNVSKRLPNGIFDESQICARDMGKDTCQGDSGGPLQVRLSSQNSFHRGNTILGVTSFGKACGITQSPGVYTRVSYYIKWIESIIF